MKINLIGMLLLLFVSKTHSQNMVFERGLDNSNYKDISLDPELKEYFVDTLLVKDGATALLTHKVIYANHVIQETEKGSLVLRGYSEVFYRHSTNMIENTNAESMQHKTTNQKPLKEVLNNTKGILRITRNGVLIASGNYEEVKNLYLRNGLYTVYSGGKIVCYNKLIN